MKNNLSKVVKWIGRLVLVLLGLLVLLYAFWMSKGCETSQVAVVPPPPVEEVAPALEPEPAPEPEPVAEATPPPVKEEVVTMKPNSSEVEVTGQLGKPEKETVKKSNSNSSSPQSPFELISQVLEKVIDQKKADLKGKLISYVPTEMKVDSFYEASLLIGKNEEKRASFIQELEKDIHTALDSANIKSASVSIGKKMEAKLVPFGKGSENILISCTPSEVQQVDLQKSKFVKWLWNIQPVQPGTFRFTMTLLIVLESDGQTVEEKITVFNDNVTVEAIQEEELTDNQAVTSYGERVDPFNEEGFPSNSSQNSNAEPDASILPDWSWMALLAAGGLLLIGFLFRVFKKKSIIPVVRLELSEEDQALLNDHIAADELEDALDFLQQRTELTTDGSKEAVSALSGRLVRKTRERSLMSGEAYNVERNNIANDLQGLLRGWI